MSLQTTAKAMCTLIVPMTMYEYGRWTVQKDGKQKKASKWVLLNQIKLELYLEAKMVKRMLSHVGHIMRQQDSLEKAILMAAGKEEEHMRLVDSKNETTEVCNC